MYGGEGGCGGGGGDGVERDEDRVGDVCGGGGVKRSGCNDALVAVSQARISLTSLRRFRPRSRALVKTLALATTTWMRNCTE